MNTMPLNVLTDAVAALKMLRDVADGLLTNQQFMQAMRADSALSAYVEAITKEIKVEATE